MANDEVLRIQVDSSQAIGALASVQQEIKDLEKELETLNSTTGVTNAELEGTAKRLEEARGKFDDLSKTVAENAEAQKESGKETKSISDKYVQLGLKVFGARQVLMSLGSAMKSVAQATGNYSGATKDAIDQVSNLASSIASLDLEGTAAALGQLTGQTIAWAQGLNEVNVELGNLADKDAAKEFRKIMLAQAELTAGHEAELKALQIKATALARELQTRAKTGESVEHLKVVLKEYLDEYEKSGDAIPRILLEQAFLLDVVSTKTEQLGDKAQAAYDKAAAKAKEHADALDVVRAALDGDSASREKSTALLLEAIKATEEHGVVTVQSQKKIKAGIEEELAKYTEYGDKVPAALQAAATAYRAIAAEQQKVIDNAAKLIADVNASAAKANQAERESGGAGLQENAKSAEELKREIAAIENSPIITLDQQNNLDALKNSLLDNKRAAQEMDKAFTAVNDSFVTDAEAAEQYGAWVAIAAEQQAKLTQFHEQALPTEKELADNRWDNLAALNQMEDAAGDAGGTFQDLGKEVGKVADEFKSVGDQGKKGTEKAKEGLDGLKAGAEEAIPLLEQIKGLLAEIKQAASEVEL